MKIKVSTSKLEAALNVVATVTPRQVSPTIGAGYLFVVRDSRCFIYSRDSTCVSRADIPVEEGDAEGMFVCPLGTAAGLKVEFLGETVTFESSEEEGTFRVGYVSSNKSTVDEGSFDPKLLSVCDTDLEKATEVTDFPTGILREAISLASPFLAPTKDGRAEEQYKGLQVFDKSKPEWEKGNGYLYASNATQTFYFQCDAFMDKQLEIHGLHLPALGTFLTKSGGEVKLHRGNNFTFAVNADGHVFGWPRQAKTHAKFSYYGLKNDQYILKIAKSHLQSALKQMRINLDSKRDKIKVQFDAESQEITLNASDGSKKSTGFPFPAKIVPNEAKEAKVAKGDKAKGTKDDAKDEPKEPESITWNVNIDHLTSLVKDVKGAEVQLRVAMIKSGDKEVAMFRTIDEFRMSTDGKVVIETEGTFQCRVTRFMPSKD